MEFKYIDGDFFESLADYSFGDSYGRNESISFGNEKFISFLNSFPENKSLVLFSQTDRFQEMFDIIKILKKKSILITHNSDFNINEKFVLPDNLIRWYTQNLNVLQERVEPLPIGLERKRWFVQQRKQKMIHQYALERIPVTNLLYLNFNPLTNLQKRKFLADFFKDKPWATVDLHQNGSDYENYIRNIKAHQFTLSPDGNGMDCHRTWETLYLNRIPVLENSMHHSMLYSELPVLLVDDFLKLTPEFLLNELNNPKYRKSSHAMYPKYYFEKITDDKKT